MASVQGDSFDQTAFVASASLASDHVRLFGSGEKDEVPILAPTKNTAWNSIVDALGSTINTHTMRISITKEGVDAIRDTSEQDWQDQSSAGRVEYSGQMVEPNIPCTW